MDDDDFFAKIARATMTIPIISKSPSKIGTTEHSASRKRTRSSAPVLLGGSIIASNVTSSEVILLDDDSDFVILPKKNSEKLDKKKGNTNLTLEEELELLDAEEKGSKKKRRGEISFAIPEENAVLQETKNQQKKLFDRIARLQSGGPFIHTSDTKKKALSSSDKVEDAEEVIGNDDPIPAKTDKKTKSTANDKTKDATEVRKCKVTFRTIDNILPAITIKTLYTTKMEKLFSAVKKEWTTSGKISVESFKQVFFKANGEKLTPEMLVSNIADEDIEGVKVDVYLPK
jgi:hypothetical protein